MDKRMALSAVLSLSLLSGCFGPKPEESLYSVFEDAAKQEASLFDEAKALETLEQKNAQLYDSILHGGQDDSSQVKETTEQALQGLEERASILGKEQKALKKAHDKMKEANQYVSKIEDKKLGEQAKKVISLYEQRFTAFGHMQEDYGKALDSEKKLYEMMESKTTALKTIIDQVKEVNMLYAGMQQDNQSFNELTKQYNQEKVAFYKEAKFHIKEKAK